MIERDAETMFRLATEYRHLPGMLRAVAGPARVHPPDCALPPPEDFPLIRASTLPAPLARVVANVRAAGVHVALRRITSDVDIRRSSAPSGNRRTTPAGT